MVALRIFMQWRWWCSWIHSEVDINALLNRCLAASFDGRSVGRSVRSLAGQPCINSSHSKYSKRVVVVVVVVVIARSFACMNVCLQLLNNNDQQQLSGQRPSAIAGRHNIALWRRRWARAMPTTVWSWLAYNNIVYLSTFFLWPTRPDKGSPQTLRCAFLFFDFVDWFVSQPDIATNQLLG